MIHIRGFIILLLAISAWGQTFPNGFTTFPKANRRAQAKLNGAINSSVDTLTVDSASGFQAPVILSVDDEQIFCMKLSGNTFSSCTRGWGGTIAASHLSGAAIADRITNTHWTQFTTELTALQQQGADNRTYNFSVTGGVDFTGFLTTAGAQVITFSAPWRCPLGAAAANPNYFVRLTNGVTSEVVQVTGGTCTSGGTGTLTFTTTQSYLTGTVLLQSATAGLREMGEAQGRVQIARGTFTIYSPVRFQALVPVSGTGPETSHIINAGNGDAFHYELQAVSVAITRAASVSSLSISCGSAVNTAADCSAGSGVYVKGANDNFAIHDVSIRNHAWGVIAENCFNAPLIERFSILYHRYGGILYTNGDGSLGAGLYVMHGIVSNNGATGTVDTGATGLKYVSGGGLFAQDMDITAMRVGVAVIPPAGAGAGATRLVDVKADTSVFQGFVLDGSAGSINSFVCVSCWAAWSGYTIGSGFTGTSSGFVTTGANIDGVVLNGGSFRENGGYGIEFVGGKNLVVTDAEIARNSQRTTLTAGGIYIGPLASRVLVASVRSGNYASGLAAQQACGVYVETAANNISIIGNNLLDNPTAGVCNYTNAGSARLIYGNLPNDPTANEFIFPVTTFSSLPASSPNGTQIYCSDCTVTNGTNNTCAGTGTGANASRINGVWRCFNSQN